ncbi:MAG TPA: Flp family type IVb pilin [Candidatus Cybelea sp.]|jgi:Flp pilus assembly pilin Flp|nr:Flp family type IVb pilin [Candidatus Cybelea sp.]
MLAAFTIMIRDEDGATMTEYGILIMLIALVAFSGVQLFGVNLLALFRTFATTVQGSTPG